MRFQTEWQYFFVFIVASTSIAIKHKVIIASDSFEDTNSMLVWVLSLFFCREKIVVECGGVVGVVELHFRLLGLSV